MCTLTAASAWISCRTAGPPPTTCPPSSPLSSPFWTSPTPTHRPTVWPHSSIRYRDTSKEIIDPVFFLDSYPSYAEVFLHCCFDFAEIFAWAKNSVMSVTPRSRARFTVILQSFFLSKLKKQLHKEIILNPQCY